VDLKGINHIAIESSTALDISFCKKNRFTISYFKVFKGGDNYEKSGYHSHTTCLDLAWPVT
jgi:hypothetical protein